MLATLDKQAQTAYPIHELIGNRWSPRAFADRSVDRDTLGSLFEAARWSASSRNEQPWRFIVATQETPTLFEALLGTLKERNQIWAKDAPVLVLAVAKRHFEHTDSPNAYAWYDVGQAMAYLSLQAAAHDLYVHQMAGFSKEKARAVFGIPEDHEPVVTAAIGYLGSPDQLGEKLREREQAERTRHSLKEIVFGKWGEAFLDEEE